MSSPAEVGRSSGPVDPATAHVPAPLRLLYVTASFPFDYAREACFFPEMQELARRVEKLTVVPRTVRGPIEARHAAFARAHGAVEPLLGAAVLRSAVAVVMERPAAVLRALRWLARTRGVRNLAQNAAVLPKALWLARLALRERATHIHAQWASSTATLAMAAAEVAGLPWSFTAHRADIVQGNLLAEKAALARFVRFISDSGVRLAERSVGGRLDGRVKKIHMGVVLEAEPAPEPRGEARRTLLCAASLLAVKGHEILLRALGQLADRGVRPRLLLAGDGPLRPRLERLAADLGMREQVVFLGHLPHERVLEHYAKGEVAAHVLPSLDLGEGEHEGIPVALLEAMSYGVPVIATATGGIPELLDGGAGLQVPAGEPAALAGAIEAVLGDDALRRRLAAAGHGRIVERYSIEGVVGDLIAAMTA